MQYFTKDFCLSGQLLDFHTLYFPTKLFNITEKEMFAGKKKKEHITQETKISEFCWD